jgi:hypothetical protein
VDAGHLRQQALAAQAQAEERAARIGPTVWELLGPMPTLNRSKTETATVALPQAGVSP